MEATVESCFRSSTLTTGMTVSMIRLSLGTDGVLPPKPDLIKK